MKLKIVKYCQNIKCVIKSYAFLFCVKIGLRISPLKHIYGIPYNGHPGYFASKRKYDIHIGIDLYCNDGDPVYALYDGEITLIEAFTGKFASPPSPWWNNTYSVTIYDGKGYILYGEIIPSSNIHVGKYIKSGDQIGTIKQVLKINKGRPTSMLHLELYSSNISESYIWNLNTNKPEHLHDPTVVFNPKKYNTLTFK